MTQAVHGTPAQARIAVFGMGYVGCVTAACFAKLGHRVVGVDVDERKVRDVLQGRSPFYEPNLDLLLQSGIREGRLSATTSTATALQDCDFAFICVGTPSGGNGNINLDQLRRVASGIAAQLPTGRHSPVVVIRSTVFPGTCDELLASFPNDVTIPIVSNPEFLREGTAVDDFLRPSLLVIGSHDQAASRGVAGLYRTLPVEPTLVSLRSAELVKYACNALHALKISFANEVGSLAAALRLDPVEVMDTLCLDTRLNISPAYLKPGFAFGGSCLPKDVRALNYRARQLDLELPLIGSILPSNEAHLSRAFRQVMDSGYKRLGIYGLAFKADTDDLRESPTVALIERLVGKGQEVRIFDRHIRMETMHGSNKAFALSTVPHLQKYLRASLPPVLDWADAVVVTQKPRRSDLAAIAKKAIPVIDVTRFAYDQPEKSEAEVTPSIPTGTLTVAQIGGLQITS